MLDRCEHALPMYTVGGPFDGGFGQEWRNAGISEPAVLMPYNPFDLRT